MEFSTQSSNDEGIKYYCAGYVARSLAKNQKCEHCRQLLIEDINPPNITLTEDEDIEEDLKQRKKEFLESINRGGLCTPSDLVSLILTKNCLVIHH